MDTMFLAHYWPDRGPHPKRFLGFGFDMGGANFYFSAEVMEPIGMFCLYLTPTDADAFESIAHIYRLRRES